MTVIAHKSYGKEDKNRNTTLFRCMWLSLIMFIYIYSVFVSFIPTFITNFKGMSLIAFALAVALDFFRFKPNDLLPTKGSRSFYAWQVFLLLYVGCVEMVIGKGTGLRIFNSITTMLVYMPLFLYAFKNLFRDKDELFTVLITVSVVQSAVIILGIMVPPFKDWINATFNSVKESNYDWETMSEHGYATGINCMTSKGALQLSLGMIGCLYFILRNRRVGLCWVLYLVISVAASAVARTGLLLAVIGAVVALIYQGRVSVLKIFKHLGVLLVLAGAVFGIVALFDLSEMVEEVFARLIRTFEDGIYDTFLDFYFDGEATVIPELNSNTFFGTGVTSGLSGNRVLINVDGGYIRTFFALGPIVAVLNYIVIAVVLIKEILRLKEKQDRTLAWVAVLVLVIGESKEYFIYERYYILLIFLFFALCRKEAKG